jgi:hypothetical protein
LAAANASTALPAACSDDSSVRIRSFITPRVDPLRLSCCAADSPLPLPLLLLLLLLPLLLLPTPGPNSFDALDP